MTFGYNSAYAFSDSVARINDFAHDLLSMLNGKRQNDVEKKRPIIFICHSLGGIIVKKAMLLSHLHSSYYEGISGSCRGIMFMGTPHRGSGVASWALIASKLVNTASLSRSIRRDLIRKLRRDSKALRDITLSFVLGAEGLQIVSVYERNITRKLRKVVVDEDSAILGVPRERIVPINADHRSMCRFFSADSQKYFPINAVIVEMVNRAVEGTTARSEPLSTNQGFEVIADQPVRSPGSDRSVPLVPEQSPSVDNLGIPDNSRPISFDMCGPPLRGSKSCEINRPQAPETVEIRIENIPRYFRQRYAEDKPPRTITLRIPSQTSISDMMTIFDREYPGRKPTSLSLEVSQAWHDVNSISTRAATGDSASNVIHKLNINHNGTLASYRRDAQSDGPKLFKNHIQEFRRHSTLF